MLENEPQGVTQRDAAELNENNGGAEQAAPRRRRRAATRPAGPPQVTSPELQAAAFGAAEGADAAPGAASTQTNDEQAAGETRPPDEPAAPDQASPARRRRTRRARGAEDAAAESAERETGQGAGAGADTEQAQHEPGGSPAPAADAPAAGEETAGERRTRSTRRTPRRRSADQPEKPGEPADSAEAGSESQPTGGDAGSPSADGRPAPPATVQGGPAAGAVSAFGITESPDDAAPPVRPPSTPLFQAPVFQAPVFQEPVAEPAEQKTETKPTAEVREEQPAPQDLGEAAEPTETSEEEGGKSARRRRRGGRRRRRAGGEVPEAAEAEEQAAETAAQTAAPEGEPAQAPAAEGEPFETGEVLTLDVGELLSTLGTTRRRRRRRRRGTSPEVLEPSPDDPPNTVIKIREPRKVTIEEIDEVQSVKGSTRLEAKRQRRREGRELGRRRAPIITEAEFLARRELVERVMVVRQIEGRTQIAVLEDGVLVEHYVSREQHSSLVGNVYLGKVQNVLPSMEAAFVDIGKGRNAVLYAGEVNFDVAGLEGQPKRIESVLKSGQSILVQVTKDPIGHKGARLTSQISLPGRYLVYVPEGSMTGISRKLPDTERTRLKQILKKVVPDNAGVIVRTAAEGATEEELVRDIERLNAQWEDIQRKARSSSAPALLYGEPDLTIRVIRDIFNEDFSKLVVSGDEAWDTIEAYISHVAPDLLPRLERWVAEEDVFSAYRIDEQLMKGLDRKVWLPSGGSLIIDRTEAMTVIDVNTGKFTGKGGNLEETVTKNNLEAAEEIVRQLRLRDIGGIIVIDFIDMVLESNRELVLRRLLECLGRDRTKHQVAEVTSLGLVQMTRKRVGQGLLEAFSETCECCNGRGVIIRMDQVEPKAKKKRKGTAEPAVAQAEPAAAVEPEPAQEPVTGPVVALTAATGTEAAVERQPVEPEAETVAQPDEAKPQRKRAAKKTGEPKPPAKKADKPATKRVAQRPAKKADETSPAGEAREEAAS